MSEAVSAAEAARLLRVSKVTAIRLFHLKKLEGYRLTDSPNSPIMIYLDSIRAYIKNVQRRPVPDAILEAG